MNEVFMTPDEVAELYRIPIGTVWRLLRQRKLPARRIGRQYRLLVSECEMALSQQVEGE